MGAVRDFYIMVDLSTAEWRQRYELNQHTDPNAWLGVQFSGFSNPVAEDQFAKSLAIAKSLDFDSSVIPSIPTFSENPGSSVATVQLDRSFTDGPLSFSVPQEAMIEVSQSYAELGPMAQASYQPYANDQESVLSLMHI